MNELEQLKSEVDQLRHEIVKKQGEVRDTTLFEAAKEHEKIEKKVEREEKTERAFG